MVLAVFSLFFTTEKAVANAPNLRGHVGTVTGLPLEGANVLWTDKNGQQRSVLTSADGSFFFPSWQNSGNGNGFGCNENPHTFTATKPGYVCDPLGSSFGNGDYEIDIGVILCKPDCNENNWTNWVPECTETNCQDNITQRRSNACGKQETKLCSCTIIYPSITPTITPTLPPGTVSQTITPTPTSSGNSSLTPTPTPTGGSSTPTLTPSPSPTPTGPGWPGVRWFKTSNGDVHSNKDIIVSLPTLIERFATYLVTVNSLSAFAAGSGNDAMPQLASFKKWYWYSPPYGNVRFSELSGFYEYYTHFKPAGKRVSTNFLTQSVVDAQIMSNKAFIVQIDPDTGTLSISEDITLSGSKQLVIYVNGDLRINHNLVFNNDSGIIFVVKGNLQIAPSPDRVDGVYLVDKTINTSEYDSPTPLVVYGSYYVSRNGKIFGQSRKSLNANIPSEHFIFEPKYLILFSQALGRSSFVWKEVAP